MQDTKLLNQHKTKPVGSTSAGYRTATVLVYIGFAITGVATTLLGTGLPAITQRLHLTDLQAGYLFAAQFLSSTAGAVLSGRLSVSIGFKRTLVAGFALIAAGIAVLGTSPWPVCLIAVSLYGMGLGIAIPACNLQIADAYPERRASALNILNFVWTGGALAWAPLGARISDRPSAFLILGLIVAGFTVTLAFVRFPQSSKPELPKANSMAHSRRIPLWIYLLTALMFFLYVGVEASWAGWATAYAQRLNPAGAWTLTPAFFWAALLAGRALAPALLTRIGEGLLLVLDLVAAIVAACVFLSAASFGLLFPALALLGFSLASVYPNVIALTTRDFEGNTNKMGYLFASAGVGGAVAPWAVGATSNHFASIRIGLLVPMIALAVMLAIQIYRKAMAQESAHKAWAANN